MEEQIKKHLPWVVSLSIIVFLTLNFLFQDNSISDNISYTISIITTIIIAYKNWIWRINPFEKTPKLHRHYKGTIKSDYDGRLRDIEIKIKQSLFNIQVFLKTSESRSKAYICKIHEEHGEFILSYNYINMPNATVRQKSEIHYGACNLIVDDPKYLIGQYFTDRKTRGDMRLTSVEKGSDINANQYQGDRSGNIDSGISS